MNSTIERIDSTRIELQRDGRQYTGIKISPTSRPDIWNLRAGDIPDTAWIFRDGRIDEWPVEGYIENQGRYCLGPRFEGERLSRLISRGKFDLKTLRKVLLTYSAVYSSKKEPEHFDASSVFLLTDGGVMILSSSMAKKQRRCLSEEELLQDYEPFQHPDIKGPTALVYSFALLAYVALSNRHPFIDRPSSPGNNNEELRERMRRAEFVPLSIMKPEIFKDAAVYIDSILDGSAADPGLSELHEFLGRVETEPSPALSQAEILRMRDLVRRREKRIHRKSILRRFFRRHKVSLGIAGILLIAGVLLTVNIMQEASIPPPTRGLEPE